MKFFKANIAILLVMATTIFAQDTIYVDLGKEYQTIYGNGINFEGYHSTGGSEVLASRFESLLENIDCRLLRIGMPLKEWEPTNDDTDEKNFQWLLFRNTATVQNSFERLARLDDFGYELWVSIWDMANWNIKNSSQGHARRIKDMDEFVECVSAYLLRLNDDYGVQPAYISVNEPTIAAENGWGGYQIALSAEEQAELIVKAGSRFKELGLATQWLIALHKVYPSELEQAREIFESSGVLEHIAGFDFHGYWWQSGHDKELAQWAEWTNSTGLPNFAGECDYDNQFWKLSNSEKSKWTHAVETGRLLYKMYNVARAEASLLWYADSPSSSRPYRYANLHFYNYMSPGCILVDARSSTKSLYATAVKHKKNDDFALVLQNTSGRTRSVTLAGIPDQKMTQRQSHQGSYDKLVSSNLVPSNNLLTISVEGQSLNTIFGKGGNVPSPVGSAISNKPGKFYLNQNYPNPFNPATTIYFSLPKSEHIQLQIFDLNGRLVKTLLDCSKNAGEHSVHFSNADLPSGSYIYRLTAGDFSDVRKMVLIR